MGQIRLFLDEKDLHIGATIKITNGDFDYLTKVMRQKVNDEFQVFNGIDGQVTSKILEVTKKFLIAEIVQKTATLTKVPNITLAFAPVKNVRVDFIAAKATELGVASFQPILTRRSVVDKINQQRFRSNVKEACEQCERNDFPEINDLLKLDKLLNTAESGSKIFILCDESGQGEKASLLLPKIKLENQESSTEFVILIGPEGGFSPEEFEKMRAISNVHSISLGPRILRTDTAIISALTLVQEFIGDF